MYLGFWQLDRADQKLSIQTDYQNQLSKEYLDLKEVQKNPLRYKINHLEKNINKIVNSKPIIVNGGIAKIGFPLTGNTQSEAVQAGKL